MSTSDADRYRNAPAPTRASNALYIPASALTPNAEPRHYLHDADMVKEAKRLGEQMDELKTPRALAFNRDDMDTVSRLERERAALWARREAIYAALGKQERGVA
jgi:hypothetical protein